MKTVQSIPRAQGLLPRVFHAYVAGLRRSLASGEQLIYPDAGLPADAIPADGRHDFDFYYGYWRVCNVRLKERLAGCEEWESFEARQHCRAILGGIGNVDDFVTDWGGGFRGMTLRLYDPQSRRWSIYWANGRDGVLEPPVIGGFENGTGTFYGRDRHKGRPVRVRFLWHEITPDSAHWEQAFSIDGGGRWETNWHMYMTREA